MGIGFHQLVLKWLGCLIRFHDKGLGGYPAFVVGMERDHFERCLLYTSTIGILLCKEQNEALVKLTLPDNANIYATQYAVSYTHL